MRHPPFPIPILFAGLLVMPASALAQSGDGGSLPLPPMPENRPDVIQPDDLPKSGPPLAVPPPDEDEHGALPDAFGRSADEPPASDVAESASLDELFAELRRTADRRAADRLANRIQRRIEDSGSATIDLLLANAGTAMGRQDNGAALDFLDQALVLDPDFAEAWNRRATLHFMMGELGKSIADIEQTLARQPRHWGALMGLGAIMEQIGRPQDALETYRRALAIYPTLQSAQEAVGRITEERTAREL